MIEFILLISSEANEICEKDSKKTILPEHIIGALKVGICPPYLCRNDHGLTMFCIQSLGYEAFVDQVDEVASEHKQQSKVSQTSTQRSTLNSSKCH
jgi:hypothetical protein